MHFKFVMANFQDKRHLTLGESISRLLRHVVLATQANQAQCPERALRELDISFRFIEFRKQVNSCEERRKTLLLFKLFKNLRLKF